MPSACSSCKGPGADPATRQDLLRRRNRALRSGGQSHAACRSPNCSAAGCATVSVSMAAPACTCRRRPTPPKPRPIAELGFRAYKMRPAAGPEQDLETVRLMRKAVGPDFDLMVDAHTWWRMGDRSYSLAPSNNWREDMAAYRHRLAGRAAAARRSRRLPRAEGEGPGAAGQRRARAQRGALSST